jgi:acyl-CoA thioesterase-1
MRAWIATVLSAALLCAACGSRDDAPLSAPAPSATTPAVASSPASSSTPRIVFLGDSLTAGLGLSADQAYPSLLQQRLKEEGLPYEVVNAGVSGDTSAGGLSRLDWSLEGNVKVLVVALGGNDALRGLPTEELKKNLAEIIRRAQARHITVVLAGMEAPPNYGRDYAVAFHQVYPSLAKEFHVSLVPFLLQGVGGVARLNQRDGIHPTAEGARVLAENVWSTLGPIVERPSS